MPGDFVKEMVALLETTPRTAWEIRIRAQFGGERAYIARRDPLRTENVREAIKAGISERTARRAILGK
jgi:hypothetical protein